MAWVYSEKMKLFKKNAIPRGRVNLSAGQAMAGIRHLADPDEQIVVAFEQAFARYIGVKHAIAVGSAKAGFVMLMRAMSAKSGQGVIVPGYNVPEVPSVLRAMNLKVIAGDIDPENYNISPKEVERHANQADFLTITHLYGNPAPLDTLMKIADSHGLQVIEDCAQALGAGFKGRRLGAWGNPAIFSFGMLKNLTSLGGGMVTTPDDDIAARIRKQRDRGPRLPGSKLIPDIVRGILLAAGTDRRIFPIFIGLLRILEKASPGLMYRAMKTRPAQWEQGILDIDTLMFQMHPAQAAMGLEGLNRVDRIAENRIENVRILMDNLDKTKGVDLPKPVLGGEPVWTNFVVQTDRREYIKQKMIDCGFDTTWGYLAAIDRIADLGDCPVARSLEARNLYLPLGSDRVEHVMRDMARCLLDTLEHG